jgi:outer membrane biosynthesis protein TonB
VSIKSAACAVAICLASSAAWAQPAPMPAGPVAGLGPILPPQEIGRILRTRGLVPQATPVRNGEAYQVRAIDRLGRQVRVAIDARYGDILMVRPIVMVPPGAYGPRPYGAPPGYYDDEPPTGALGAYPPPPGMAPSPGRTATLAPAHPPIPRPKPAAKPAAATVPEAKPAEAASPGSTTPATAAQTAPAASAPPATAAAPSAALPPVAPLE